MSLILDALRKMEQERKSRRGAAADLRPEVLRYRADVQPEKSRPWAAIALGSGLVAVGVVAGIMLKGGHSSDQAALEKTRTANSPAAADPPAVVLTAPTAPTAPAPPVAAPPAPASSPAAAVVASAAEKAVEKKPAEASTKKSASAPETLAAPTTPAKTRRKSYAVASMTPSPEAPKHSHEKGSASSEKAVDDTAAAPADLRISGIAWQDERNLRRAVVNGSLVGEGAEVAGARIVEIKESKVRFTRGGRTFDVPFSSSLSSR